MSERLVTGVRTTNTETQQQAAGTGKESEQRRIAVYAGGTVSKWVEESRVYETDSHYDQDGRELFR
jgi:hypothetical protein